MKIPINLHDIILETYNKHIPQKIFKKLKKYYDWELLLDFEQDMITHLYEIPTSKLITLYENKELDNYFAQICLNQLVNLKSNFNRLYETTIEKSDITDYENIL